MRYFVHCWELQERQEQQHGGVGGVYCANFGHFIPRSSYAKLTHHSRRGRLMNVVSIGEVLWDIVGQQEYLGGASFNFSAHLHKLGHTVSFISAVGADDRG